MEQLILHLFGDYILQSDWMANNKTSKSVACSVHALTYTLPFLLITNSLWALVVIGGTHFFIDRYRLAKYVVYAKNFIAPPSTIFYLNGNESTPEGAVFCAVQDKYKWKNCKETGYPKETPVWLSTWLLIIADNSLHLAINYLVLKYL